MIVPDRTVASSPIRGAPLSPEPGTSTVSSTTQPSPRRRSVIVSPVFVVAGATCLAADWFDL